MLLEHKTAVIYGAGGAVGSAVARAFASEGATVHLAGRHSASLLAVRDAIAKEGGRAEVGEVDVREEASVQQHFAGVLASAGDVDISFNCAYFPYDQGDPVIEMTVDAFTFAITDVMRAQFFTTRAAGVHMSERGSGVILAITATPARNPIPLVGNFGVACAAIEALCRQLAVELGPRGVRVVCLRSAGSPDAPGVARSFEHLGAQLGISTKEFEATIAARTALKRLPLLAEVANAAVIMASDRASAITGAVANVTSGEVMD
jgi:3-oxoacyl-[acyl-carrier protein] reductase